jgi:hypothetical protein
MSDRLTPEREAEIAARAEAATETAAIEGEHYAAVHHNYRLGRDLPYTQTAKEAS